MPPTSTELVRRYFEELINLREYGVCEQIIAEDYLEHAVPPFAQAEPGRVNGPRATRESIEWLVMQFPDIHMTIEALVSDGDTIAVRTLSEGTNLGKLNGVIPPTGRRFAGSRRACRCSVRRSRRRSGRSRSRSGCP